jgi:DNA sulfur modification protein DndD
MYIKSISIQNYLCYYGSKKVLLSPKLNLILGDNGTGKTKLFEAIHWLLNGCVSSDLVKRVSAKAVHETAPGDNIRVSVSIKAMQFGEEKHLERFFEVKKISEDNLILQDSGLQSIITSADGRKRLPGQPILDQLFPIAVKQYLMFKGEETLNVFGNPSALNVLIESFSKGKHYPKYSDKSSFLVKKSQDAIDKDQRTQHKNNKEFEKIAADIKLLESNFNRSTEKVKALEANKDKADGRIKNHEAFIKNAEKLRSFNTRIENIETSINKEESRIDEEYTTYLFDKKWILNRFAPYQNAFLEKVTQFEKNKRREEKKFQEAIIEKLSDEKAAEKLVLQKMLPLHLPGKSYVEEMISSHQCGVCGTDAPEGSAAHQFMVDRLTEFQADISKTKKERAKDKVLYQKNYIKELLFLRSKMERESNVNIDKDNEIQDLLEFNEARKLKVLKLSEDLEEEKTNRRRVLSSSTIAEQKLLDVMKSYGPDKDTSKDAENDIRNLHIDLKNDQAKLIELNKQKDAIVRKTGNEFLINTRDILKDVKVIFDDTESRVYSEFVEELKSRSNTIFDRINVNAFTGRIEFKIVKSHGRPEIQIGLIDSNGNSFSANKSLSTTMYMAVLFAISDLSKSGADEFFPIVFDAPTSSFGEAKTKEFLNMVSDTEQQRIVIFYDFVEQDNTGRSIVKSEFHEVERGKAYLLQLERPFDREKIETLNTLIEEI